MNNSKFEFNNDAKKADHGHKRSLSCIIEHLKKLGHNVDKMLK